jgi:hypothetical protein
MHSRPGKTISTVLVAVLCLIDVPAARAQVQGGSVAGTVTGPSGAAVANATVVVKNLTTSQVITTTTNSAGAYSVPNLPAGEYEVSVSAEGLEAKAVKVTVAAAGAQALDVVLVARTLPAPSLSDLGFSPQQLTGSPEEQARLDRRTHMLKIHQRLGLFTTAPLAATVVAGLFAGGRQESRTGRNVHAALGAVTAGMYWTSASFAIFAPKVKGAKSSGPTRVHKMLAWVHGTGMVLTPLLGAMAYHQLSQGQRVHGIASYHGAVGVVTLSAYAAAIMSVSIKF